MYLAQIALALCKAEIDKYMGSQENIKKKKPVLLQQILQQAGVLPLRNLCTW